MLPPETTHTTRPLPPSLFKPAATDAPPAPSATTAARSTSMRIAAWTSARLTTSDPASSRLAAGHISASTIGAPMPSTNVGVRGDSTGRPASNAARSGAAVSTSHPYTRTSGLAARIAAAMPQLSPPPPNGTSTASTSGASSRTSSPMVPLPAMTPTSETGWMNRAGSRGA